MESSEGIYWKKDGREILALGSCSGEAETVHLGSLEPLQEKHEFMTVSSDPALTPLIICILAFELLVFDRWDDAVL